jgi:hypothetical protein
VWKGSTGKYNKQFQIQEWYFASTLISLYTGWVTTQDKQNGEAAFRCTRKDESEAEAAKAVQSHSAADHTKVVSGSHLLLLFVHRRMRGSERGTLPRKGSTGSPKHHPPQHGSTHVVARVRVSGCRIRSQLAINCHPVPVHGLPSSDIQP